MTSIFSDMGISCRTRTYGAPFWWLLQHLLWIIGLKRCSDSALILRYSHIGAQKGWFFGRTSTPSVFIGGNFSVEVLHALFFSIIGHITNHVAFFIFIHRDASFHILITNYQILVNEEKLLRRVKWQYMVLDEAQAIKSSSRWIFMRFACLLLLSTAASAGRLS